MICHLKKMNTKIINKKVENEIKTVQIDGLIVSYNKNNLSIYKDISNLCFIQTDKKMDIFKKYFLMEINENGLKKYLYDRVPANMLTNYYGEYKFLNKS